MCVRDPMGDGHRSRSPCFRDLVWFRMELCAVHWVCTRCFRVYSWMEASGRGFAALISCFVGQILVDLVHSDVYRVDTMNANCAIVSSVYCASSTEWIMYLGSEPLVSHD